MFIRWSRRTIRTRLRYLDCPHSGRMKRESIAASLAKTERRDGKIQQRIVGPIGFGIRSCCLSDPVIRTRFWTLALEDLNRFKIDGLPRVRAIVQLAAVVKPPSEAERAMYERRQRRQKSIELAGHANEEEASEVKSADATTPEVATLHANHAALSGAIDHEVSPKTGVP